MAVARQQAKAFDATMSSQGLITISSDLPQKSLVLQIVLMNRQQTNSCDTTVNSEGTPENKISISREILRKLLGPSNQTRNK